MAPEIRKSGGCWPKWGLLPMFIICIWPYVQFANANRTGPLQWEVLAGLSSLLFGICSLLTWFLWRLNGRRDAYRFINAASVLIFMFLSYNGVEILLKEILEFPKSSGGFVRNIYVLLTWACFTMVLTIGSFLLFRGRRSWTVLTTIGGVGLGIAVFSLGAGTVLTTGTDNRIDRDVSEVETKLFPSSSRHNIYFFIYDGYARHDTIKDVWGYDNSEFLTAMESRGFFVARQSLANYPITRFSIAATFLMNYLPHENLYSTKVETQLSRAYSGDNPVIRTLKQQGYNFIFAPRAESGCIGIEDICVVEHSRIQGFRFGEMEIALLKMTPLYVIVRHVWKSLFNTEGVSPQTFQNRMSEIAKSPPSFTFYHNMDLHDSLVKVIDGKCTRRIPEDLQLRATITDENVGYYLDTIRCSNEGILKIVDDILARDPDALLVIQADHGVRISRDDWNDFKKWSVDEIRQRFAILNLMRLPPACRNGLYEAITPVNTFRLIFQCLGMAHLPLLTDRSYWVSKSGDDVRPVDIR